MNNKVTDAYNVSEDEELYKTGASNPSSLYSHNS